MRTVQVFQENEALEPTENQFGVLGSYVNQMGLAIKTNTVDFLKRKALDEKLNKRYIDAFVSEALKTKFEMDYSKKRSSKSLVLPKLLANLR